MPIILNVKREEPRPTTQNVMFSHPQLLPPFRLVYAQIVHGQTLVVQQTYQTPNNLSCPCTHTEAFSEQVHVNHRYQNRSGDQVILKITAAYSYRLEAQTATDSRNEQ